MTDMITFTLDGQQVQAKPGESIFDVAKRHEVAIPHLCYAPEPGYRADGNCRACMVEIEGERVLAASCIREPREGMVVHSANERARKAQEMVVELLVSTSRTGTTSIRTASSGTGPIISISAKAGSNRASLARDQSHVAMAVDLDACINCGLCVRAAAKCRSMMSSAWPCAG